MISLIGYLNIPHPDQVHQEDQAERHHDLNGGDSDVSAKAAEHSKETKARYYKKVSYKEA